MQNYTARPIQELYHLGNPVLNPVVPSASGQNSLERLAGITRFDTVPLLALSHLYTSSGAANETMTFEIPMLLPGAVVKS
jgi:hypothetical protein